MWRAVRNTAASGVIVSDVIPLPRASVLAGVMIIGVALGMMAALIAAVEITATVRPDVVIGAVIGVPSVIGMLMIPKTCAYVWTVMIGYNAMKKELRK